MESLSLQCSARGAKHHATRAASEGTAGVRGGLGGGGAGAASFAVGEQLQNMSLWSEVLGVLRVGSEAAVLPPAMGPGPRRGARREPFLYVIGLQGQWCGQTGKKGWGFEMLVSYMPLAICAAASILPHTSA